MIVHTNDEGLFYYIYENGGQVPRRARAQPTDCHEARWTPSVAGGTCPYISHMTLGRPVHWKSLLLLLPYFCGIICCALEKVKKNLLPLAFFFFVTFNRAFFVFSVFTRGGTHTEQPNRKQKEKKADEHARGRLVASALVTIVTPCIIKTSLHTRNRLKNKIPLIFVVHDELHTTEEEGGRDAIVYRRLKSKNETATEHCPTVSLRARAGGGRDFYLGALVQYLSTRAARTVVFCQEYAADV